MRRFKRARDIRVGVVGYGGAFDMGKGHLLQMQAAGMTPIAVAEIDEKRLKVAEEHFPGIETYDSAAKMLKNSDVNLVTIITPHNTHAKLALQCLRRGRHVVSEKPFAITTAECDAMIREAKKRRLMLSTYHNRHWDGCILEAVRRIKKRGEIGDIYRIEAHMGGYRHPGKTWRASKAKSGGILYDWGVHCLEYALQLIDSDIVEIAGYAKKGFWAKKSVWKKDANEDEALAVVRFKNGVWLTLTMTNTDSNPKRGQLEITGTKGSYIMSQQEYEIIKVKKNGPVIEKGPNTPSRGDLYYKNVARHLVKGVKLIITPEWARRPIHILELADKSVKLGRALKAKYR